MTVEEYFKELRSHDWFYEYSDDHSVWRKGLDNRSKLYSLAKENDVFALMLNDYNHYINAVIMNGPQQEEVSIPELKDYL